MHKSKDMQIVPRPFKVKKLIKNSNDNNFIVIFITE